MPYFNENTFYMQSWGTEVRNHQHREGALFTTQLALGSKSMLLYVWLNKMQIFTFDRKKERQALLYLQNFESDI